MFSTRALHNTGRVYRPVSVPRAPSPTSRFFPTAPRSTTETNHPTPSRTRMNGANRPIPSRSWTLVDRAHALSPQGPASANAAGLTRSRGAARPHRSGGRAWSARPRRAECGPPTRRSSPRIAGTPRGGWWASRGRAAGRPGALPSPPRSRAHGYAHERTRSAADRPARAHPTPRT